MTKTLSRDGQLREDVDERLEMIQGKQIRQGSSLADRQSGMSGPEINEVSAEQADIRREWLEKIWGKQGREQRDDDGERRHRKDGKFKNN